MSTNLKYHRLLYQVLYLLDIRQIIEHALIVTWIRTPTDLTRPSFRGFQYRSYIQFTSPASEVFSIGLILSLPRLDSHVLVGQLESETTDDTLSGRTTARGEPRIGLCMVNIARFSPLRPVEAIHHLQSAKRKEGSIQVAHKKINISVAIPPGGHSWNTLEKHTYDPLRQFKSDLVQARPYKSMQLRNVQLFCGRTIAVCGAQGLARICCTYIMYVIFRKCLAVLCLHHRNMRSSTYPYVSYVTINPTSYRPVRTEVMQLRYVQLFCVCTIA